jgi:DNA ligase-1
LAQEAPPDIDPAGWLVSEKFDGVRAWWDGLVLRFRSGLIVAAPAAFLKALPPTPLDGELWLGRGRFDELSGIVRRGIPDDAAWQRVRYMAFEMPGAGGRFEERALRLQQRFPRGGDAVTGPGAYSPVCAVPHFRCVDHDDLKATLERVVAAGGEGLMLHRADAPDIQGRSPLLLKLKPLHDDEAVVVGYQAGFGRLSGRMGALQVLDDEGRQFEVGTGFSDAQRLSPPAIGTRITFTHHGRTPSGVPRFASFLRERPL